MATWYKIQVPFLHSNHGLLTTTNDNFDFVDQSGYNQRHLHHLRPSGTQAVEKERCRARREWQAAYSVVEKKLYAA